MTPPSPRRSAAERREELVAIAIRHFGESGYLGASTEAIARDAGISQPYLFRLFGTKRDLFLACQDEVSRRIRTTFRTAAAGEGGSSAPLKRMGEAYIGLLQDREVLLFQMQSYAASADPVIQAHVRQGFGELVALVVELSRAEPHEIFQFFSHGMLLNVIATLDLAALAADDPWAASWCEPAGLVDAAQQAAGRTPA